MAQRSVFSAGRDALLDFVAQRDAQRIFEEDRAAAAADRVQRQKNIDRELGQRDRSLASLDEDRDERRRLQEAASQREAAEAAAAEAATAARAAALDRYTEAVRAGDEEAMKVAGIELLNLGGKTLPSEPKPTGFTLSPGQTRYGPDGKPIASVAPRPTAASTGPKDDPKLPRGVKQWIESMSERGDTIEKARHELSKGWQGQRQSHPNASLAEAAKYLDSLFPRDAAGQPTALGAREEVPAPTPTPIPSPKPATPAPAAGGMQWVGQPGPMSPAVRPTVPIATPPGGGGFTPAPDPNVPKVVQEAQLAENEEVALSDGSVWRMVGGKIQRVN